jgi:hypothetical protein
MDLFPSRRFYGMVRTGIQLSNVHPEIGKLGRNQGAQKILLQAYR